MAETTTDSIKVIFGEIPEDCNCTIYRIASRSDIQSFNNVHLPALDGYGQVHKFTFLKGAIKYKSEFVKTERYKQEVEVKGAPIFPMLSWKNSISRLRVIQSLLKYKTIALCANTNVIPFGKYLYAFYDGCLPHSLNPDTLETHGIVNIPKYHAILAHAKLSNCQSTLYVIGRNLLEQNKVYFCELDCNMNLVKEVPVITELSQFHHDFFVYGKYTILILSPAIMSFSFKSFFKKTTLINWKESNKGIGFCVIDNTEGKILKYVSSTSKLFLSHVAGARITHEKNKPNKLELFGICYENSQDILNILKAQSYSDLYSIEQGKLYSFSIDLDNKQNCDVPWQKVWDGNCDVCAENHTLRDDFCIVSAYNSVTLFEFDDRQAKQVNYEDESLVFEPSFDGTYIYIFYNQDNRSYLDIFSKNNFYKDRKCCTLELAQYVPLFVHGSTVQNK